MAVGAAEVLVVTIARLLAKVLVLAMDGRVGNETVNKTTFHSISMNMNSNNIPASPKRRSVQITITEKCNLDCIYCYEKNKDLRVLPLETIQQIITDAFAQCDKWDEIEFDFHGGEVALVFDTLKAACEWLWSKQWPKPYLCFATTNGTLIHGEIQEWFYQNRECFWLGLSLDGTPEMHNANRSNSYDKIDFDFFRRCWPKQPCKMTLSPLSLPTLAAGVKHIIGLGFDYTANLAYGVAWDERQLQIYAEQLSELIQFYLDNPELKLPHLLDMSMRTIGLYNFEPERRDERHKWCGTGDAMVCYGCDGRKYPCQTFMPSVSERQQEDLFEKLDFSNCENFDDPDCADCVIKDVCPVCYGHNYIETGSLFKRPKDLCRFRKIEALAASCVQGKMLLNYQAYKFTRDLTDYERKLTAQGVKLVQEAFGKE